MTFQLGDKVIYPNHGLGIVERIEEKTILGTTCGFFHLRIVSNDTTVLVPVANVDNVGLRKAISDDEVERLFTLLSDGKIDNHQNWKGRFKDNSDKMRTGSIYDIGLTTLVGQPVWRVETSQGVTLHALDGAPLVLGESLVRELASRRYAGPGALTSLSFEAGPTLEARGAGAVWRAEFDDPERTTLYFSSDDGRLVAARNDTWRLFDWFWMFHTMDYRGRDNFNNPVVIAVGTAALWLVLSGFLLLFRGFRREDFAS